MSMPIMAMGSVQRDLDKVQRHIDKLLSSSDPNVDYAVVTNLILHRDELQKRLDEMKKGRQSIMAQNGPFGAITPPSSPNFAELFGAPERPFTLEEKMSARMDWGHIGGPWAVGFAHMAMQIAGDKVHVWIITKDAQSVVLEDDASLYPSDALITKIRLMQRGE